ncbi:PadR family transcriptional regulator [Anaerosoma tenue]|uniref:PadR family transcriptional regulator n=1 Tax=Anaerosoma tenue TaxID=2933588 RepID=UPI002260FE55|nr:PadR family transcriptional regulator [Anaerosoma tenue]MCK8115319.1 PadR family transcriptional regulator [Anaerosoma tenue]
MTETGDSAVRKFQKELNAGTVALVLLSVLNRSEEPLYGYQIAKRLEEAEADGIAIKQGTLYPVLRSLEGQGLLSSRVEPSVSGPPRKYYSITGEGVAVLDAWSDAWHKTRDFVDRTLQGGRS